MEVTLEDIQVMFVRAEGGSEGAKEAFDKLESRLPSLRDRKFYGTYHAGEYRACVALRSEDDPSAMGLDAWIIPGGRYVRTKMKDWSRRIPEIGKTFMALAEQYPADPSRPSIEYYRSQQELILHLPVSSLGRVTGQETVKKQKAPSNDSLERAPDTGRNHGFDAS